MHQTNNQTLKEFEQGPADPILTGRSRFPANPEFKNILVTGGAGFIASWLVRHLVVQYPEYNVYCFDHMDYCATERNVAMLESRPNFTFVYGDITSQRDVEMTMDQYDIDTVIHLAAESSVELSFDNGVLFTHTNVIGTQILLEACRTREVSRFIQMSTDEVYGELEDEQSEVDYNAPLVPTNPYSASKAAADMIVTAYERSFRIPCIKVRCNNIYGPHQYPEKIIPKFICLLQRGERCTLHGSGKHRRRYLYVADAIDALDTILHKGKVGCTYNVGTTVELTNLEVTKRLLKEFGYNSDDAKVLEEHVDFTRDRVFNDMRYAVDSTLTYELGWRPVTSFEEGLKSTVQWYRQYGANWWGNVDDWLVAFPSLKKAKRRPSHPYEVNA
uniref:ARAD1C41184p n=1 Tax=Blastobotrys adeninivorans TaxID=409370 RepID=A0A060T4J8_BLAAD